MAKAIKQEFLNQLAVRFGTVKRLNDSQSLFEIGTGAARVYVRYSKLHFERKAFYGLRLKDLKELEGYPSVICFLWDGQTIPLMIPFSDYEQLFQELAPADDGQFKAQFEALESWRPFSKWNTPRQSIQGLRELCSFLEYANVFGWHQRLFNYETESK